MIRIIRTFSLGGMLSAVWQYRQFIVSSIRSDYRARFVRSRLGTLWMVLNPLVNAAIFAMVLAELMAAKLPGMATDKFANALYLMAGMLAWSLFSEVVTRSLAWESAFNESTLHSSYAKAFDVEKLQNQMLLCPICAHVRNCKSCKRKFGLERGDETP